LCRGRRKQRKKRRKMRWMRRGLCKGREGRSFFLPEPACNAVCLSVCLSVCGSVCFLTSIRVLSLKEYALQQITPVLPLCGTCACVYVCVSNHTPHKALCQAGTLHLSGTMRRGGPHYFTTVCTTPIVCTTRIVITSPTTHTAATDSRKRPALVGAVATAAVAAAASFCRALNTTSPTAKIEGKRW
jgi:hypothetical protein